MKMFKTVSCDPSCKCLSLDPIWIALHQPFLHQMYAKVLFLAIYIEREIESHGFSPKQVKSIAISKHQILGVQFNSFEIILLFFTK